MSKNLGLIGGVLALSIGLYFGFLYSAYNGGESVTPKQGALQLYSEDGFFNVTLKSYKKISPDTYIYTFDLPRPDISLGLETGQHILVYAVLPTKQNSAGEEISRKYTPISKIDQTGTFDLLIKIYRAGVSANFPDGGLMTQYIEKLKIGDSIKISGPRGKLTYKGEGDVTIDMPDRKQKMTVKKFGFLAGGTGITPMYQVIRAVLENPDDDTSIALLFGNRSENDILLRTELEEAGKDRRIKANFTIDAGDADWKGLTGHITKEMITKTMPPPADDVLICTCGPKAFNQMLRDYLLELGYKEENIFKF